MASLHFDDLENQHNVMDHLSDPQNLNWILFRNFSAHVWVDTCGHIDNMLKSSDITGKIKILWEYKQKQMVGILGSQMAHVRIANYALA